MPTPKPDRSEPDAIAADSWTQAANVETQLHAIARDLAEARAAIERAHVSVTTLQAGLRHVRKSAAKARRPAPRNEASRNLWDGF